jgi:hypothetical protein
VLDSVVLGLRERQHSLERDVFVTPPASMDDFNKRLGAWLELDRIIGIIEASINKDEEDD